MNKIWGLALIGAMMLGTAAQAQILRPTAPPAPTAPSAPAAPTVDVQRIAAVVNDQVITNRDVEARLAMTLRLLNIPDSPQTRQRFLPQILQTLIDERIQTQEASRRGVIANQEDLGIRLSQVERQFNIQPGQLDAFLAARGIDRNAFLAQMRNEAQWQKYIFSRLLPSVSVTDEEVASAFERILANAGEGEALMSEVFLAVENPDQEEEVRRSAQRLLEQIRATGNFAGLARLFSQAMTAAAGGDMGWVQPENLPEEIGAMARAMEPGTISEPIRAVGGYYIIAVREKRRLNAVDPGETRVNLKQIILPVPENAPAPDVQSQTELAALLSESIASCQDADRVIQELRSQESGTLGTVRLRDLPANVRAAVEPLAVGRATAPVRLSRGVAVFVVCEKLEAQGGLNREQVRNSIINARLQALVRRTMRDLSRDAVIERR